MKDDKKTNESKNSLELNREADRLLAREGYDIFGRPKGEADFLQSRSERMYIRCAYRGASRRKNG